MIRTLIERLKPAARETAVADIVAGRYRVGPAIGHGARSVVHDCVDLRTGRPLAIKLSPIPADLTLEQRAEWLGRTQRELHTARRLAHPDILALHDGGIDATRFWLVTERVAGHDLAHYTRRDRLLPEAVVLDLSARLALALAHAHAAGIVHRDLKPANVLLDLPKGLVKLGDFGVLRLPQQPVTATGMTLGTPAYMAPELLAGQPASPASDVYALGVLAFELLTGRRPHRGDSLGELLHAIHHLPADDLAALRPDLPRSVTQHLAELLHRQPERRPADLPRWSRRGFGLAVALQRASRPPPPLSA